MKILFKFIVMISVILSFFSVLGEEKERTSENLRLMAGIGVGLPGVMDFENTENSLIGSGFFVGIGFKKLDFIFESDSYSVKTEETADSSFDDIPYKKTYEYSMLSLSVRYRFVQNKLFSPYAGGWIGITQLDIYDNLLKSGVSRMSNSRYYAGPVCGVVFFPNWHINGFMEIKYALMQDKFDDYSYSSSGLSAEWEKNNNKKTDLSGIYINMGVSCTIF